MKTYTQILYHVIFRTYKSEKTITKPNRPKLFKIMWSIFERHECHVYAINGVEDHVHIAFSLNPKISLSEIIRHVKVGSTQITKQEKLFQYFNGWQEGYGGFTFNYNSKNTLIKYLENQEEHHKTKSFEEEYLELLKEFEVDYDVKYVFNSK